MLELIEQHNIPAIAEYYFVRAAIVLACWTMTVLANFIDFWSGRDTAKALGEKIDSHGLRRTFAKISDYYRVLLFFMMFDILGSLFDFYRLPFATVLSSMAVITIEMVSVWENSKRKKSHAADVPEIVKRIVQCGDVKKSAALLAEIAEGLKTKDTDKAV